KQAGHSVNDILSTLQGYYGGVYASNFNQFGKQYRVIYQADPMFRANPQSLNNVYVRNQQGVMAPSTGFINLEKVYGPQAINRFTVYAAMVVTGTSNQRYSSGDAIADLPEVAEQTLPAGYGYEFSGMTRE